MPNPRFKPGMRAIQTQYQGYKFRSRLEARWAVLFDNLGYKWVYEPEGYKLSDGTCYLPDFYLPQFGIFAEVKPDDTSDWGKSKQLAKDSGREVLLCAGDPANRSYQKLKYNAGEPDPALAVVYQQVTLHQDEEMVRRGVAAARSARFEHGEQPAVQSAEQPQRVKIQEVKPRGLIREAKPHWYAGTRDDWNALTATLRQAAHGIYLRSRQKRTTIATSDLLPAPTDVRECGECGEWVKSEDNWCVRILGHKEGDTVTVLSQSGEETRIVLGRRLNPDKDPWVRGIYMLQATEHDVTPEVGGDLGVYNRTEKIVHTFHDPTATAYVEAELEPGFNPKVTIHVHPKDLPLDQYGRLVVDFSGTKLARVISTGILSVEQESKGVPFNG
jgi:hypothetical protein